MCSYSMNSPTMRVRELEEEVRKLKCQLKKLEHERIIPPYTEGKYPVMAEMAISVLKNEVPYNLRHKE